MSSQTERSVTNIVTDLSLGLAADFSGHYWVVAQVGECRRILEDQHLEADTPYELEAHCKRLTSALMGYVYRLLFDTNSLRCKLKLRSATGQNVAEADSVHFALFVDVGKLRYKTLPEGE